MHFIDFDLLTSYSINSSRNPSSKADLWMRAPQLIYLYLLGMDRISHPKVDHPFLTVEDRGSAVLRQIIHISIRKKRIEENCLSALGFGLQGLTSFSIDPPRKSGLASSLWLIEIKQQRGKSLGLEHVV